ncbi:hypothetical protein CsSME_00027768 [Camellia sinensis var. sinensis]
MVVVQHLLRKIENFVEEHPSKNELAPHKHPLSEFDGNEGGGEIKCDKCQQLISQGPTCVCWPCKYFIHKSCKLELPLKIDCWFHNRPSHPPPLQADSFHKNTTQGKGTYMPMFGKKVLRFFFWLKIVTKNKIDFLVQ